MNKKIVIAAVCTIAAFGIGISALQNAQDHARYSEVFAVDATFYPQQKHVEIKYSDNTGMTGSVIVEILGMSQSFQRTFDSSSFSLLVPFDSVPQYGWRSTPVTFVVEHQEFGTIGIKVDIHNDGEPAGGVIFSRL